MRRRAAIAVTAAALLVGAAAPGRGDRLDLEIEGVSGDLERNVRASLGIADAGRDADEARIRRLHGEAEEEIAVALQPFGYYRPTIEADLEEIEDERWLARYRIDPGPVLRLEQVDVGIVGDGASDPELRGVAWQFPLDRGDALVQPLYEEGKQALAQVAAERGYLDATFVSHAIEIDLEAYSAAVDLQLTTGPRYYFGEVSFRQDFLEDDLLRGYVTFEPGDPFDLSQLLRLQDALSDSPYFQRVEVVPQRDEAVDRRVPIEVLLTASRRQRWVVGAGYGTDTGPRASVELDVRRVNRRGHRAEVDLEVSEVESTFAASYLVPGRYPRTDVVRYSLGYADLDTRTANAQTALVGVGLTRSRGRWREGFSLSYQEEDYEVGLDEGTSELLLPEAEWSRVWADDRLYPSRGIRVSFRARGASEDLLSDATFLQGLAEGKWVRSVVEEPRIRLLVRSSLGYTETGHFRRLPASVRFFAGGEGSVRGYGYHELGRTDEAGNVIGGETLATASVELDSIFLDLGKWGRWGGAVFYDVGGAGTSFAGDLQSGAGLGLRWLSPVGPVRADAALALDLPGTPVRFHFSLGPDL